MTLRPILRRLWLLAPVLVAGITVGVIGWGGFNTAMEATNTLGFCVSCHEMRDNVYEEYKKTAHYQNASGVRAICSDCHVPRDWTHKVIRKVQATQELYHWALGTIDTKEKFEAHRHDLAKREWQRMRDSDSRECRNCHSFEAMDFHKQDAKAATAMAAAMKAGKTCIDCHKGIAHNMPDINAGHRADFARLAATAAAFTPKPGVTAYTIGPVPFRLERDNDGASGGELAATAAVKVLAAERDLVQIEITGWQRDGSPALLYQQQGTRIPVAKLSAAAVTHVETIETKVDPETDYTWTHGRLKAWTKTGSFAATIDPLWTLGARIYDDNCTICHAAHAPDSTRADEWIGHMNAMKRFTPLRNDEAALLQSYLQNHAKDIGGR